MAFIEDDVRDFSAPEAPVTGDADRDWNAGTSYQPTPADYWEQNSPSYDDMPPRSLPTEWTGDADMGFTATGSTPDDYTFDDTWYPPYDETGTRPINFGSNVTPLTPYKFEDERFGTSLTPEYDAKEFQEYASPQGRRQSGSNSMDPQLRDLLDAGPTAYARGMYDKVGPSFGPITTNNQWANPDRVENDPFFTNRQFRSDFDRSLSRIPDTMVPTWPLFGTLIRPSLEDTRGALGLFNGSSIWSQSPNPDILLHEYGHYADAGTNVTPGLIERAPDTLQQPRYQDWRDQYGDNYGDYVGGEVTAEEAMRAMRGGSSSGGVLSGVTAPPLPSEAERYLLENLMGVPGGQKKEGNPFVPGSAAFAIYNQYLENRRSNRPGDW